MSQSQETIVDYPYVMEHKIRVIGYFDRKQYIYTSVEEIRSHWKLWVMGKQPLLRIAWNPAD